MIIPVRKWFSCIFEQRLLGQNARSGRLLARTASSNLVPFTRSFVLTPSPRAMFPIILGAGLAMLLVWRLARSDCFTPNGRSPRWVSSLASRSMRTRTPRSGSCFQSREVFIWPPCRYLNLISEDYRRYSANVSRPISEKETVFVIRGRNGRVEAKRQGGGGEFGGGRGRGD